MMLAAGAVSLPSNAQKTITLTEGRKEVNRALPQADRTASLTVAGKTYTTFNQWTSKFKKYNKYIKYHGCAVTSLTCVLRAWSKKYRNLTPPETIARVEKKVAGTAVFNANYGKSPGRQMPITLYGIDKVLKSCHIKSAYVETFTDAGAKRDILAHLKKGKCVVVTASKRSRTGTGRKGRWAYSYHTMVLVGVSKAGKVVVADSANRRWYKSGQRFKVASINDILNYMFPCTSSYHAFYWNGRSACGGYVKVG